MLPGSAIHASQSADPPPATSSFVILEPISHKEVSPDDSFFPTAVGRPVDLAVHGAVHLSCCGAVHLSGVAQSTCPGAAQSPCPGAAQSTCPGATQSTCPRAAQSTCPDFAFFSLPLSSPLGNNLVNRLHAAFKLIAGSVWVRPICHGLVMLDIRAVWRGESNLSLAEAEQLLGPSQTPLGTSWVHLSHH